jgi:hypothetical protein
VTAVSAGNGVAVGGDRVGADRVPAAPVGAFGGLGSLGADRVGGDVHRGWFPVDAERHRRDAPRYCPGCAAALALAEGGQGLVTEYWTGSDRVFVCFCGACGWSGDIVLAARIVGHEAAD